MRFAKSLCSLFSTMAIFAAVPVADASVFIDDFSDPVRDPFWGSHTVGNGPTAAETSGVLQLTIPSNTTGDNVLSIYESNCTLEGDFDVTVDYQLLGTPTNATRGWGVNLQAFSMAGAAISGIRRGYDPAIGSNYISGATTAPAYVTTTQMSGRLRLQRVGGTAHSFYWDGPVGSETWVELGSGWSYTTDPIRIAVLILEQTNVQPMELLKVALDNFTIADGATLVCPYLFVCGNGIVTPGEQCEDGNILSGDGCCGCRLEPLVPVDVAGGWQLNVSCPGEVLVSRPVEIQQNPGSADVLLSYTAGCGTFFGGDGQIRAITSCTPGVAQAQVCGQRFASPEAGIVNNFLPHEITFPPFSSSFGTCSTLASALSNSRLDGDIEADASNRAVRITGVQRLDVVELYNSGGATPCFTTNDVSCSFGMQRSSAFPGMNMTVEPLPGVTITFLQIYDETRVLVTVQTAAVGTLPANFQVVANGVEGAYLDVHAVGGYAAGPGAVTVCIPYRDVDPADGIVDGSTVDEGDLKILHEEGGVFVDRTSSRDPVNNRICASVASFSQFALGAGAAPTLPSLCGTAPRGGCRASTPAKSSFQLKKGARSDQVAWKWVGGATTKTDWGDPLATTDYQLCVYDHVSGVPISAMATTGPAGGTCDGRTCWSDQGTGFKYGDRAGTPDGLSSLQLKAGDANRAKITLKGRGTLLHTAPLPLKQDTNVTVQLVNSAGTCWEAKFSSASRNDTRQFKATSD